MVRWLAVATILVVAIVVLSHALSGGSATRAATAGTGTAGTGTTAPSTGGSGSGGSTTQPPSGGAGGVVAGMPPVLDPHNIYSALNHLDPKVAGDLPRVYVPNGKSNTVSVIDPATKTVVATLPTGATPQHIVPSYDMRTLWVLDNLGNTLIPIDAATGTPGAQIPVDDPYNLYFTPDGREAIVVAERHARLDFRDPHTMALHGSLDVTGCDGINHGDYSADGRYLILTCEFAGKLAKVDMVHRKVVGFLTLQPPPGFDTSTIGTVPSGGKVLSMPQDIRTGPDGRHFYVADMLTGGVHIVDGDTFREVGFVHTGIGTHGITPSHDGTKLYVSNRGWATITGGPHGKGSVSVIDVATNAVVGTWDIPGGGSPDMGNLTADGTELWLSGRFDQEVYAFDTVHGVLVARIAVGNGPHGLTVWPQTGRYSLGHTGNMR